jgi:molybdenum cofactor guanylyltransferase
MKTGGIILCGGRSSRMGRPKAWLPFGEELMLSRVVRLLGQVVGPLVVVAAPGQDVPPVPGEVILVRDEVEGRGPLQGLKTGLEALRGQVEAAYLSSCDVPFLKPALVLRLVGLLGEHSICVPRVGDHHHPLAAVYRVNILPTVDSLLTEDRLRPFFLFGAVPTRVVSADELSDIDPEFQSLRNLNTPEDYEAAIRSLKDGPSLSQG